MYMYMSVYRSKLALAELMPYMHNAIHMHNAIYMHNVIPNLHTHHTTTHVAHGSIWESLTPPPNTQVHTHARRPISTARCIYKPSMVYKCMHLCTCHAPSFVT